MRCFGRSPLNLYGQNSREKEMETERREIGTDTVEIHEKRRSIRRQVLKVRDAMNQAERKKGSLLMTERILGHQWFYGSDKILCFASYGSEIDTYELIREAICKKKQVFLPKVTNVSEKREMCFYRVTDLSELSPGYMKIPEPAGNTAKYVYDPTEAAHTLMLMPGVAFDGFRNRLGYGKGFYDGFLAEKQELQLRTIAIGFRCQMVDEIPAMKGDVRPYQVICT